MNNYTHYINNACTLKVMTVHTMVANTRPVNKGVWRVGK